TVAVRQSHVLVGRQVPFLERVGVQVQLSSSSYLCLALPVVPAAERLLPTRTFDAASSAKQCRNLARDLWAASIHPFEAGSRDGWPSITELDRRGSGQ